MRIHKCQRMQNRSAFTAVTAGRSLAAAAAERSLTADGAAAGRSLTAAAAWSGEQILLPHLSFEPEKQLMTRTLHSFGS